MFRRSSSAKQTADAVPVGAAPSPEAAQAASKGRPTPSRKQAETARKQRLGRLPTDPKQARKAEREANRVAFERSRQALKSGDTNLYPVRDRGAARAFVRNYVDGRLRVLELLMPLVILSWISILSGSKAIYYASTVVMEVVLLLAIVFGILLSFRVKKAVLEQFGPDEVTGVRFYAVSRAVMPRPLRQPKAVVTMSGKPKV